MLLKTNTLNRIARGEVTIAFRRWRKPTVKAGTRLHTAVGVLQIERLETVELSDIGEDDIAAAGFADRTALLASLGDDRTDAELYRIIFGTLAPDERVALSSSANLTPEDQAAIVSRFARWQRARPNYHLAILRLIAQRPATPAGVLAGSLGVDKVQFKSDVRRLKALGLTESLPVGYRLSPRGASALQLLDSAI